MHTRSNLVEHEAKPFFNVSERVSVCVVYTPFSSIVAFVESLSSSRCRSLSRSLLKSFSINETWKLAKCSIDYHQEFNYLMAKMFTVCRWRYLPKVTLATFCTLCVSLTLSLCVCYSDRQHMHTWFAMNNSIIETDDNVYWVSFLSTSHDCNGGRIGCST